MLKIGIGTKNPGKIEGARRALLHYYEEIEIQAIAVDSNVPEQPVNEQIYQGAKNRVEQVKKYCMEKQIEVDMFLAVESGIIEIAGNWMIMNIAVLQTKDGIESYGSSCSFPVPKIYVQEIIEKNLNTVMNQVLGEDEQRHNQKGGIELLTKGIITRIDQVEQAFVMAMIKCLNENWR